jgi:glutamine amidotransferase
MIGVVDYGMGNIASILNMFKKAGASARAIQAPNQMESCDRFVLPGVGSFDHGMQLLRAGGWVEHLDEAVRLRGMPILGICLGLQLMTRGSEEGVEQGLGWIDAECVRLQGKGLRVPHMGWTYVSPFGDSPLFRGLDSNPQFYFVHSFRLSGLPPASLLATADYGEQFPCAAASGSAMGVQFHPEKSHKFGMVVLRNFAELP